VSIDGANVSLLDPVSFDRQRDLVFSGIATRGTVFFRDNTGTESEKPTEFDVSRRESGGASVTGVGNEVVEKSGNGASTTSSSTEGLSERERSV